MKQALNVFFGVLASGMLLLGCSVKDSQTLGVRQDIKSILVVAKGLKTVESQPVSSSRVPAIGKPQNKIESNLCWAIFVSPKGFPQDPKQVVKQGCVQVISSLQTFRIEGLPEVTDGYAVTLFQDMNKNGILDTKKMFGLDVPSEPFGLSNNPSIFTPPTYEKCKIVPVIEGEKFTIQMKSL